MYFPDKLEVYKDDVKIMAIKNLFINYNLIKDDELSPFTGEVIDKQKLWEEYILNFTSLNQSLKDKILAKMGLTEQTQDEDVIYKINIFYQQ